MFFIRSSWTAETIASLAVSTLTSKVRYAVEWLVIERGTVSQKITFFLQPNFWIQSSACEKCKYSTKGNYYVNDAIKVLFFMIGLIILLSVLLSSIKCSLLTLMKCIVKCVTTALPTSDRTVRYEDVCVERGLLRLIMIHKMFLRFTSSHRGRDTWGAAYRSSVNVTLTAELCDACATLYY